MSRKWKETAYHIYYGISQEELIQQIHQELYGCRFEVLSKESDRGDKGNESEISHHTELAQYGVEILSENKLSERV